MQPEYSPVLRIPAGLRIPSSDWLCLSCDLTCAVTLPFVEGQDGTGRSQEGERTGLEEGEAEKDKADKRRMISLKFISSEI